MEQNIQKPSLPIKTKIAAWWIIVVGGGLIIFYLFLAMKGTGAAAYMAFGLFLMFSISFITGLIFLFSGTLLLKRKKWGWWFSIIILFLVVFFVLAFPVIEFGLNRVPVDSSIFNFLGLLDFLSTPFLLPLMMIIPEKLFLSPAASILLSCVSFPIYIPPLVLLLLDRKNFWKIAT